MKGIFSKAADSFDQVRQMVTRKLPVPELEGTDKFIQFTAKRTKCGHWTLSSNNNVKTVTAGLQAVSRAFQNALEKHYGRRVSETKDLKMNFDTAFLILRDMEESLLKYNDAEAGAEPPQHHMAAYRLLPKGLKSAIDEAHFARSAAHRILEPRKAAAPAPKLDNKPKPN